MSTKPQQVREKEATTGDEELPEGWSQANLGSLVESMKNGLYKPATAYADNGVACLRMYNIERGKIVWKAIKRMRLTPAEAEEYRLAPGDLLINRVNSRELVGKTAVIPKGLEACVYESKNIRVRLIPELANSDFVNYCLLLFGQRHFSYNSQQVVGMASISQPQIAEFPLPLPPRAEQDRLVSKIATVLERVDLASARIASIPKILKIFRQVVLAAASSGKLTEDWRALHPNAKPAEQLLAKISAIRRSDKPQALDGPTELPVSWAWVFFGSLIGELRNGISTKPEIDPPGRPMLRISAVRAGKVVLGDRRYLRAGGDYSGYELRDSDLLFTRYNGSLDLLGVCGMVRGLKSDSLLYPDKLMRVRFDHEFVMPPYVEIFFASPGARDRITEGAVSSAGQQGISGAKVKSQPFALPPVEEQHEIVRRVEALFKLADAIEKRVAAATLRAEKLTQAILAKAFRGELVPTEAELARRGGRSYEPASVLLERIRAERGKAGNGPKRSEPRPKRAQL